MRARLGRDARADAYRRCADAGAGLKNSTSGATTSTASWGVACSTGGGASPGTAAGGGTAIGLANELGPGLTLARSGARLISPARAHSATPTSAAVTASATAAAVPRHARAGAHGYSDRTRGRGG